MSVIIVLIAFSLLVALFFLGAYIWSVKTGQFDDKYTPSVRILFDDKKPEKELNNKNKKKNTINTD